MDIINQIKQRMSLRKPLQEALDIVADLSKDLTLSKEPDLVAELTKVNAKYPKCSHFESEFVSIAFSIATGVGKTRLMAAIITYLYKAKGTKNFFILAPNLTIYNKLIKDFGDSSYAKYVFKGIDVFVHQQPVIVTGDNYAQQGISYNEREIRINIFNVSKFNADNKSTTKDGQKMAPRIKRLSEYLGQSYWQYLSELKDLVILMDEAHRYRADASRSAINELKPVLGIELTATPFDQNGRLFKNVVYEYNLAQALADGKYVKSPAITTRKDFDAKQYTAEEIERIKLEDGLNLHKQTKADLESYALQYQQPMVKPFVLVVCKDITHAKEVYALVDSVAFFDGSYRGKVLQIDSSTKKEEIIEAQFLALESVDNPIEIVIHVNMLKEGWDVTNLYTIVPLRASNAPVLIEQTIGRGLRLPFGGQRTGIKEIDRLTIVAHDNFQAVLDAANKPDSILNKVEFIEVSKGDIETTVKPVLSVGTIQAEIDQKRVRNKEIADDQVRQLANNATDAEEAIVAAITKVSTSPLVRCAGDLQKPEVKVVVLAQIETMLAQGQGNIFAPQIFEEAAFQYETVVAKYKTQIIEIPRMDLVPGETKVAYADFDLDTSSGFNYQELAQEMLIRDLKTGEQDSIVVSGRGFRQNPMEQLVAGLLNFSDIDYEECQDLLHKLANQAVSAIEKGMNADSDLAKIIEQFKRLIVLKIYDQIKQHIKITVSDYQVRQVLPFTKIEPWSYTALNEVPRDFKATLPGQVAFTKTLFSGFLKACHLTYKFDSRTELDFAHICEHDGQVIKWLRPAHNQFRIYWGQSLRRYEPDFVVETANGIFIVETKAANEIATEEVQQKKLAAHKYCQLASEFTSANGGKPWAYVLLPHDEVNRQRSWGYLLGVGN